MVKGHDYLLEVASYQPGASEEEIRRKYGLTDVIKLASNENPFGPSPRAIEAAREALARTHRYNDGGAALRDALASKHGCAYEAVTVNNGSDALIHQIMRTFLLPGETALSCEGGFVSFGIAVRTVGSVATFTPMAGGYRFDVEALAAAITSSTKIVYVPNPNNPTGTHLSHEEVAFLLSRLPTTTLLVLDEAYTEYATAMAPTSYPDGIALAHPNVLTLRTFSKAYGLAAMRIGYAVGSPDVVKWLLKTKLPFDPNGIGCAAALAALADQQHVEQTVTSATSEMKLLSTTLHECGYTTSKSVANFVFIECGSSEHAKEFHDSLLHRGFITRPLGGFGHPSCVRISLGLPEQNAKLAEALKELASSFVND